MVVRARFLVFENGMMKEVSQIGVTETDGIFAIPHLIVFLLSNHLSHWQNILFLCHKKRYHRSSSYS